MTAAAVAGPIGGPDAQRLAQQELSRPEYAHDNGSWVQRLLDTIGRWLGSLFSGTGGGGTTTALVVVTVLLLAVLLFAAVRAGRLPGRRRRRPDRTDPLRPEPGIDHARRAADLAARGELAQAVREYLRDAVATLERRGVLDRRPGRTGAAAAREGGRALPAAAPALDAAARAFDEVWFGDRAATTADVDLARRAATAVRDAAPVGGGDPVTAVTR